MTSLNHHGGCHCGNLHVALTITKPAGSMPVRSCSCSFCRSHGTRTISDPNGQAELNAETWDDVTRYRFGTGTADYILCKRCGVYIGAVCDFPSGARAVINTRCLTTRDSFIQDAAHPNYDNEPKADRLRRREMNWMPIRVQT